MWKSPFFLANFKASSWHSRTFKRKRGGRLIGEGNFYAEYGKSCDMIRGHPKKVMRLDKGSTRKVMRYDEGSSKKSYVT